MRLATWNILSGRPVGNAGADVSAFREAIRTLDPDVLALQEVDRAQPRSHRLDLAAIAAEAMGAVDYRFVPALVGPPDSWRMAGDGSEDPDLPAYGVALLSRLPASGWQAIPLPGAPLPVPFPSEESRIPRLVRDEPRVAVAARVETPRGPLEVVATHLSFLQPWNVRQLRRLMPAIRERGRPLVLMGDLNLRPRRVARITGLTPLAAGATFPSHAPMVQIDHLLADGVSSAGGRVVRLPVSDHRALVAEL